MRTDDESGEVVLRWAKAQLIARGEVVPAPPVMPAAPTPVAEMAPCYFCQSTEAERSPCPLCHKCVCQLCAEAEGESCCDAEPAAPEPSATVSESMHEELRQVMLGERRAKEAAEAQLAAVRRCVDHLRDATAAARRRREPKTGMQVPYHGEFASAVPSVIRDLEWFVRAFDRALAPAPSPGAGGGK